MTTVFQPVVRISYHGNVGRMTETAAIVTYDLYSEMHTTPPKELPVTDIPILLFQLVERGYVVRLDTDFKPLGLGAKSILAFSKEWVERVHADTEKSSQ